MEGLARVGDSSDHGGTILDSPQGFVFSNGIKVAVMGANHSCPIPGHGVTPIVSSPVNAIYIDGIKLATVGAKAGCGATIVSGEPRIKAE